MNGPDAATMRELLRRFDAEIDWAYQQRLRRQCSREDFAAGYVAALVMHNVAPPAPAAVDPIDVARGAR